MDLFLIRHAIAEERRTGLPDAQRALTKKGRTRFEAVVQGLDRAGFRFDHVYFTRFRLNQHQVRDYPNLAAWRRRVWDFPGVQAGSHLEHARKGYFGRTGNALVPMGPDLEF